jgi:hypothetical protein
VSLHDPYREIPFEILLVQISLPFAVEHFRPKDTFKIILHAWLKLVGDMTGLTDRILPMPGTDGAGIPPLVGRQRLPQHPVHARARREGEVDTQVDNSSEGSDQDEDIAQGREGRSTEKERKKGVWGKVIFILSLAWITISLLGAFWLAIPLMFGRRLLSLLSLHSSHDVYAYAIGFYISGLQPPCLTRLTRPACLCAGRKRVSHVCAGSKRMSSDTKVVAGLISEAFCSSCFYVASHGTAPIFVALGNSLQVAINTFQSVCYSIP